MDKSAHSIFQDVLINFMAQRINFPLEKPRFAPMSGKYFWTSTWFLATVLVKECHGRWCLGMGIKYQSEDLIRRVFAGNFCDGLCLRNNNRLRSQTAKATNFFCVSLVHRICESFISSEGSIVGWGCFQSVYGKVLGVKGSWMKEKYLGFSKKRFCGEGVKGVGVGQKGRRKRTIFTHKEKENKYFLFILFFISIQDSFRNTTLCNFFGLLEFWL